MAPPGARAPCGGRLTIPVEDVLPEYHHSERHALEVDATPERALAAVRSVTPKETPMLRALFRLRGLSGSPERPIWEQMVAMGFGEVARDTLAAEGRPWRLLRGLGTRPGERSYATMAMDFRAEDGLLSTETRVLLTDSRARRRFRAYWLLVRPFSGLVRRSWLRAAKRRAEARA